MIWKVGIRNECELSWLKSGRPESDCDSMLQLAGEKKRMRLEGPGQLFNGIWEISRLSVGATVA